MGSVARAACALYGGRSCHCPPVARRAWDAQSVRPGAGALVRLVDLGRFRFALAAGGLGWRHQILRRLDADPGRGLFLAGTVVGLVGLAAIATSYIIGFTDLVNPHDQSIAVLATSLGGSAVCNVGTAMYAKDSSNLTKAWKRLSTF